MKKIVTIISMILMIVFSISAEDIIVTQDITDDTTWRTGNRYFVTNDITVSENAILNIESDVEILFDNQREMIVEGKIIAESQTRNIEFNPNNDTWKGIKIYGDARFVGCVFTGANETAVKIIGQNNTILTGTTTFENCLFSNNVKTSLFLNDSDIGGAAISVKYINQFSVTNSAFRHNRISSVSAIDYPAGGGAISLKNTENVLITSSDFMSNESTCNGGAISYYLDIIENEYSNGFSINISSNNFSQNSSLLYGGAVSIQECDSSDTRETSVLRNILSTTIEDNNFTNNISSYNGGGAYIRFSDVDNWTTNLINCLFVDNQAENGGGFSYENIDANESANNNLTVFDSKFLNNRSQTKGGGVYIVNSIELGSGIAKLIECEIIGNQAGTSDNPSESVKGGGIYSVAACSIMDSKILENYSAGFGGGYYSLYNEYRNPAGAQHDPNDPYESHPLVNTIISHNTAENDGGGVFAENRTDQEMSTTYGTEFCMHNTTISSNKTIAGTGSGVYFKAEDDLQWPDVTAFMSMFNSVIFGNLNGSNSNSQQLVDFVDTGCYVEFNGTNCIEDNRSHDVISNPYYNNDPSLIRTNPLIKDNSDFLYQDFAATNDYPIIDRSPCLDENGEIFIGSTLHPILPEDRTEVKGKGYSWLSFPRLPATGNQINGPNFFEGYNFGSYQSFGIREQNGDNWQMPSEIDIVGQQLDGGYYYGDWDPLTFDIQNDALYKVSEVADSYPAMFSTEGNILPEDHTIDLQAGENWVGYWLTEPQTLKDAFTDDNGDYYPEWDKIKSVKSEDVYYCKPPEVPHKSTNNGRVDPVDPGTYYPDKLFLEYGKGYVVELFSGETITDFSWIEPTSRTKVVKTKEVTFFDIDYKADYEVVDVLAIDDSTATRSSEITEIGVFQNDVCVGATVVDSLPLQILLYTNQSNRDTDPLEFEIVYNNRSRKRVANYSVMNLKTQEFEAIPLFGGQQDHSIIRLTPKSDEQDSVTELVRLYDNYPNPFNPTTNISFYLPEGQQVNLDIYNIRGQKVRSLQNGQMKAGQHRLSWTGKDDNGKSVTSGVYFYKLKTESSTLQKKMLLLK